MSISSLINSGREGAGADRYAPLVTIYADASCIRNGAIDSSAGGGAVLLDENRFEIKLVAKYLGPLNNQQAEIVACAQALEQLRRCCRVEIVSDSRYVIDTLIGHNRIRTNLPFWNRLVKACYGHHISWRWVKGHSGVPFQEVADRLARASSKASTDLPAEDLEQLSGLLGGSGQFDIRDFEMELEKVVSKYGIANQAFVHAPTFNGIGTLPSAFSA